MVQGYLYWNFGVPHISQNSGVPKLFKIINSEYSFVKEQKRKKLILTETKF